MVCLVRLRYIYTLNSFLVSKRIHGGRYVDDVSWLFHIRMFLYQNLVECQWVVELVPLVQLDRRFVEKHVVKKRG